MTVTVYEMPNCVQCVQTKRVLERARVPYEVADLMDPGNHDYVKGLGYLSAPVVVVGDRSWSGFRPDLINELVEQLNNEEEK